MYEQVSHSLLNDILIRLNPAIKRHQIRHFYTRLGANFYTIYSLFHLLYGRRDDFEQQMQQLVETMANRYIEREDRLKESDLAREKDHNWFLDQRWVAMAMYGDGFAGDLNGVAERLGYLQDLGVNMVHVLPILQCPEGRSDGGYAVSDFRQIDQRVGGLPALKKLVNAIHQRDMLLVLDVVVNHTSNEHRWAQQARAGEKRYQDYYYMFDNREVPDMFEQTMPEIFPETAPGNFVWDELAGKWVMSVFNEFQWDLNYSNPAVFIEMIDIILFWANQGADIIRLDAVAFLWKKIGSTCQNEREAHLLLQLFKDCCQVSAPGVLFIAEAIVAPVEIIKYFGEDAINAKECEVAYNATLMALLWDASATKNAKLLYQGLRTLPDKLERATWLNYVRCHDDIGLGFDDGDIVAVGYDPLRHRQFLIDYYTGAYDNSEARGFRFGYNPKTGDARISGSLASLVGLELALESNDAEKIQTAVNRILLLHGMIMSFGGIPLLYYGDEIGTLNDCSYLQDADKVGDSRWVHRPQIDWDKAERRLQPGSVEYRIFNGLKKMIAVRKELWAFADFNNRELIPVDNAHLLVFNRFSLRHFQSNVLVVANFDARHQYLDLAELKHRHLLSFTQLRDACTGEIPSILNERLVIPPYRFYWLID